MAMMNEEGGATVNQNVLKDEWKINDTATKQQTGCKLLKWRNSSQHSATVFLSVVFLYQFPISSFSHTFYPLHCRRLTCRGQQVETLAPDSRVSPFSFQAGVWMVGWRGGGETGHAAKHHGGPLATPPPRSLLFLLASVLSFGCCCFFGVFFQTPLRFTDIFAVFIGRLLTRCPGEPWHTHTADHPEKNNIQLN